MKNIRRLGGYAALQFVRTAHSSLQRVFDRTDILYRCEMGKRVTFLFMVAYALVMISSGRCAYRSSPRALGEQTGAQGASSSTALLNTARILTKTNCWKISLSNPQGHCQRTANCIYFSFKILKSSLVPLQPRGGAPTPVPPAGRATASGVPSILVHCPSNETWLTSPPTRQNPCFCLYISIRSKLQTTLLKKINRKTGIEGG